MARKLTAIQGGNGGGVAQEPIDVGAYDCRVVRYIELGMQPQSYQGEAKPPRDEVDITYELVDEFCKDADGEDDEAKPRWQSERFPLHSLTSDQAKSTQRYLALDPNIDMEGDFSKFIGMPCSVSFVHNKVGDRTYVNVQSVSPLRPKAAKACPELVNPPVVFLIDEPDLEVFNKFPGWLQDKIKGNLEYNGSKLQALLGEPEAEVEVIVDESGEY